MLMVFVRRLAAQLRSLARRGGLEARETTGARRAVRSHDAARAREQLRNRQLDDLPLSHTHTHLSLGSPGGETRDAFMFVFFLPRARAPLLQA